MKKIMCILLSGLVCVNIFAQKEKRLLIPFTLNKQIGFIDQYMKLIYPAEFSRLLDCTDEFALVQKDEGQIWGQYFIDSYGNREEIDPFYNLGFLPNDICYIYAEEKSSYNPELDLGIPQGATMIFNLYGKEKKLLPHVQLFTSSTLDYINAVITDSKSPHLFRKTYVNIEGKPSFPNIYRSVCGYFRKNEEATYISSSEWRGDFRILTKTGEIREKYIFDELDSFYSGLAFGLRQGDRALGFFDTYGELKIPIKVLPGTEQNEYGNYHFENGVLPAVLINGNLYAVFYSQRYPSKNWCLINTEGKIIKSGIEATYVSVFFKGVCGVCNKEEKYALMKNNGIFITDFIFDELEILSDYFIQGKTQGKDVLVDRENGKIYYCEDFR